MGELVELFIKAMIMLFVGAFWLTIQAARGLWWAVATVSRKIAAARRERRGLQ